MNKTIEEIRDMLAENFLISAILHTDSAKIPVSEVEKDGRKRKSAIKPLLENKWVMVEGAHLLIKEAVLEGYEEVPCDDDYLFQLWKMGHTHTTGHSRKGMELPNVTVANYHHTQFDVPHLLYLHNHADDVQWYVIVGYQGKPYYVETLAGPMPFDKLATARHACQANMHSTEILVQVSTPGLKKRVVDYLFEAALNENYAIHLPWGLVSLGILNEDEGAMVTCGDPGLSMGQRGLAFSKEPEQWEDTLVVVQTNLLSQLENLQKKMAVAHKMDVGIRNYGGWDKFLKDYREALAGALREDLKKAAS